MNKTDTEYFKNKLLAEKKELETQLAAIGQKNPDNASDWQATTKDIEVDSADENEVADKLEELEDNNGIVQQLESQLVEVNSALDRIKKGTYGKCEKCDGEIEKDRLEANPSSRVSIKHKH